MLIKRPLDSALVVVVTCIGDYVMSVRYGWHLRTRKKIDLSDCVCCVPPVGALGAESTETRHRHPKTTTATAEARWWSGFTCPMNACWTRSLGRGGGTSMASWIRLLYIILTTIFLCDGGGWGCHPVRGSHTHSWRMRHRKSYWDNVHNFIKFSSITTVII